MPVVNAYEMWSRRRMERRGGSWTAIRGFSVLMESPADPPEEAILYTDIPREGDEYPGTILGFNPRCGRVQISERPGPLLYTIEAEYSTTIPGVFMPDNPLEEPPKVSYGYITITEERDVDLDGQPITNTAGDPVRGLTADRSDTIITIVRNEATFSPAFAAAYRNHINLDTFLGGDPGTVKCNGIRGDSAEKNGVPYWIVTYEFQHTVYPEWSLASRGLLPGYYAWDWHYLNMGLRELKDDGSGEKPTFIRDLVRGGWVSEPQLLDEDGHYQQNGPGYVDILKRYPRIAFAPLGLE